MYFRAVRNETKVLCLNFAPSLFNINFEQANMAEEINPVTYEDLAAIEDEFQEIDLEISEEALIQTPWAKTNKAISTEAI